MLPFKAEKNNGKTSDKEVMVAFRFDSSLIGPGFKSMPSSIDLYACLVLIFCGILGYRQRGTNNSTSMFK